VERIGYNRISSTSCNIQIVLLENEKEDWRRITGFIIYMSHEFKQKKEKADALGLAANE